MPKHKTGYCYETANGFSKGEFNIGQMRNGGITIVMGNAHTALSHQQVQELQIAPMELKDFDWEAYSKYYKLPY